jgi:hypothetical protein
MRQVVKLPAIAPLPSAPIPAAMARAAVPVSARQSHIELGIEPIFWPETSADVVPAILPFDRAQ